MRKLFPFFLLCFFAGCGKNTYKPEIKKVEITRVKEYTLLTLTNHTGSAVNLSGWKLTEEISFITTTSKDYNFQNVSIPGGGSLTFTGSQLGFRLQKPDETIYLYDQSGKLVDQMSWVSFEN